MDRLDLIKAATKYGYELRRKRLQGLPWSLRAKESRLMYEEIVSASIEEYERLSSSGKPQVRPTYEPSYYVSKDLVEQCSKAAYDECRAHHEIPAWDLRDEQSKDLYRGIITAAFEELVRSGRTIYPREYLVDQFEAILLDTKEYPPIIADKSPLEIREMAESYVQEGEWKSFVKALPSIEEEDDEDES